MSIENTPENQQPFGSNPAPVVLEEGAGSGKSPLVRQFLAQAAVSGARITVVDSQQASLADLAGEPGITHEGRDAQNTDD